MVQHAIEGAPIVDGRPLTAADLPPAAADTLDQWIALARRIRGQFSIIARSGTASVAVTDLTGTYPVFQSGDQFETAIERWTSRATLPLSAEGISRFAAYGTA